MASTGLELRVVTNLDDVIGQAQRMAAYFNAAPDDDPVKQAMAAFGEIDPAKHLITDVRFEDGRVTVAVTFAPELQRVADMVPT